MSIAPAPLVVVDEIGLERRDNLQLMLQVLLEESGALLPREKCVLGPRFARIDGELRDLPRYCR